MNSTVAIVDDGLDMYSDDLKDNYVSSSLPASFNTKVAGSYHCPSSQPALMTSTTTPPSPSPACPMITMEPVVQEKSLL